MKGNVIRLNIMHLNSVQMNSIGEVQSVSLKAGESTEDPVYPPTTYTLAANVSNGKVTATKNGTAISLPYVATEGDVIVLSVTPDEGYEFNGWLDGNKSNPRTVTMTGNVVLSASCVEIAKPTYTLSASVTNGMVSATRNGSAVNLPFTANEGDTIVVEVTPNDGYSFEGWADGNTDNPRTITMTADVVLSAQCVEVVQPPVGKYIQFEDAEVERVLMSKGVSSDGVGITMEDAASVTSISTWFKNNKSISAFTELRFFTNVKTLVDNAFLACSSLKYVDLTNIETMGVRVFGDGGDLSEYDVDMPNLKTLSQGQWNQLFSKTNIRSIVNLGTITKLEGAGANASCFDHCVNLQSAYLPNTLTDIGNGTFAFCSALTNVDIPSSVVTIGTDAFAQCKALEEFNIPQSVQSIGENAFGFDDNLQKLKVRASVPPSLATDNVFQGCPLITIYVPDASLEAYKTAVNWSAYADRIHPLSEIEGGHVTTFEGLIGAYTFEGRSNDDADRDIVEDKSGYNNTLTLKSMQWGFIDSTYPDLVREGLWDDALWISQSGYGEITLPNGLTDFTIIAKRTIFGIGAGGLWSPLVGTGKSSGKGLFWLEYHAGDGKYTTQVNGLKYTLSSLESEVTWLTNTHYNGHRLTGTQGNNVHDGMVYINRLRGDTASARFQKIYAIYLFNRQLSPSEIEAFIKEKIDASYVLPTIEQ